MLKIFTFILLCFASIIVSAQSSFLGKPSTAFEQFQTGEILYTKGNYKEALSLLQKATKGYKDQNNEAYLVSAALEALAMVNSGQKEEAFFVFKDAEKLYKDKKAKKKEAITALKICLGKYHWEYNEKSLAMPLLKDAERSLEKTPNLTTPAGLKIELYELLGETEFAKGAYPKALGYYEKAVTIAEKLKSNERNTKQLADHKMRVGEIHDLLLEPDEAVDRYQNLLDQKDDLLKDDAYRISELNFRIGASFFKRKQYERSLPYLEKALAQIEQNASNIDRKADIQLMLATVYSDRKLYAVAIDYNSQALEYWLAQNSEQSESIYKGYLQEGDLFRKVDAGRGGIGWYKKTSLSKDWKKALTERGLKVVQHKSIPEKSVDYNLALLEYEMATDLISKFPTEEQVIRQIEVHMAKGALYLEASSYANAKLYYQKALDLMKPIYPEKHPLVAEASRALSEIYLAEQLYSDALSFVNKAMNASLQEGAEVSNAGAPNITKAMFPYELLSALGTKGIILHELNEGKHTEGDLLDILEAFDAAQELLNQLRQTHRNEGAKYRLTQLAHKFSHQAVITCDALYKLTKKKDYLYRAFDYAELTKGASLLEAIRDLKAQRVAGIPDSLVEKENELKVQIAYLQSEVFYELKKGKNKDTERLLQLDIDIQQQQQEHKRLVSVFEEQYPIYFELKYDYAAIGVEDVQQKLNEHEVLIEYVLLDSILYVLTIDKQDIQGTLVQHSTSIAKMVKDFVSGIRKKKFENFMRKGHTLYQLIIEPLLSKIENKDLIIIPDAELNYLPFEALPINKVDPNISEEQQYKQVVYLVEQYPVVYNYSSTLYTRKYNVKPSTLLKQISTWAPDFNTMDQGILDKKLGDGIRLEPLPGAKKEAQDIGDLFENSKVWLGNDATEANLKEMVNQYHVLHIATHGMLNDKEPMYSSLVLKDKDTEDGLLHTYELYNMQIAADMVVLSACNSGVGKLQKGEGVISIARGFVQAGVPNIVMTIWPVSDQATQQLMTSFYKNLKKGKPKHKALQEAKIEFLEKAKGNATQPYYWSGFLLAGNTTIIEPLVMPTSYLIWYLLGAVVLLMGIIIVFVMKKKTK